MSTVDLQEVKNAIAQAMKEIRTRFDLKGSGSDIQLQGEEIQLDLGRRVQAQGRARRARGAAGEAQRAPQGPDLGQRRQALGGTVRQRVSLQKGIPTDKAREIVKLIKGTKLKVQAAIQGEQVRVTGKNRDDLQAVIQLLRGHGPRHRHAVHQLQVARVAAVDPWRRAATCAPQADRAAGRGGPRPSSGWWPSRSAPTCRLVDEVGRYVQQGGGKRIRPALLLLACRLLGHRGDRAVLLASVVEFIHTATLLHDDIIDEATTRRGRASVNSRWGNDVTVLLGDFLYTKSMAHGPLAGQPARSCACSPT